MRTIVTASHTLRDEILGHLHDRGNHEEEGEDQQAEQKRRDDLAQDVVVDDPQYQSMITRFADRPAMEICLVLLPCFVSLIRSVMLTYISRTNYPAARPRLIPKR